jgi:16S rRNA (cytosine967-C5)-methyltransferase
MPVNARQAAYEALSAVMREGAYTSFALKKHLPAALSDGDKRFATRLVLTTLENLIRIDHALSGFIKSARVHGSVRNILRLGACQLLFLNVDAHAAVNESVALAKKIKPQTSGFVNGVLRALDRGKESIAYPQGKTAEALSVAASYPLWICKKYIHDFDYDFAEALLSYRAPHTTAVRVNTLKTSAGALETEFERLGLEYAKGSTPDSYAVTGLNDIESLPIYQNGWMAIQSESAIRAVLAAGIREGETLLDCCAAPGGKSAYAAALAGGKLDILAWDIHAHRIDMMKKNFERLGVAARTEEHDAREFEPLFESRFDVVLVDAPCSAMGLMAHSPDIRYTRKPEDIAELTKLQSSILETCAQYVKPGGRLVYSTCSINREENEGVTDAFVARHENYKYNNKPATLYPHLENSDGFYIAVIGRK